FRLPDWNPALLAHELLHVIRPTGSAAGGAARFPSTERVDPGPRARRRSGAAVRIGDAGLYPIEELPQLVLVFRVDARCEAVLGAVRELDSFVERDDLGQDRNRHEQFF